MLPRAPKFSEIYLYWISNTKPLPAFSSLHNHYSPSCLTPILFGYPHYIFEEPKSLNSSSFSVPQTSLNSLFSNQLPQSFRCFFVNLKTILSLVLKKKFRIKYGRVSFCDGSFYDDSLLRPLSSRTEHSRLVVHHCRNSSVLSLLSTLPALFRCACGSSFSILVKFF
jgi:hypothetical protein